MNMWTAIMVISIVAITSIARVLRARYHAQNGVIVDDRGRVERLPRGQDTEAMERELATLRERIKVLERIATDANNTEQRQSRAIADEIESLRDR